MRAWFNRRPPPRTVDMHEAYRLWAPAYPPRAHTPLMRIEERATLGLLPDVVGRRVLDLACGSGRYLRLLAQRNAAVVLGCDLSRAMLERARAVSPALAQSDMRQLPFAASSFDVVVCGLALGDGADLQGSVAEIARVLRPGGVALWSDLHPDAAQHGWTRTFEGSDGRAYALPHHPHGLDEHRAACRRADLVIDEIRQPAADEGPHLGQVAALVVRAVKPPTGGPGPTSSPLQGRYAEVLSSRTRPDESESRRARR